MFVDEPVILQSAGQLNPDLNLPVEWRLSLIRFIAGALPAWRDDPDRPSAAAETTLTSQLCGFLNTRSRKTQGWDSFQFRVEEPDETVPGRAVDLVAAPSGVVIWIEGRRYTQYQALLPIECKRLPIPASAGRDEREYLHSRYGSRGGIQRFKAGDHGAAHRRAALIGYIQAEDIGVWQRRIGQWILDLSAAEAEWSVDDMIHLVRHDADLRLAQLASQHGRARGLEPLALDHLWIQM